MKKSTEVNELNDEMNISINKLNEDICNLSIQFNENCKKLKKEMSKIIAEEKIAVLIKIAEGLESIPNIPIPYLISILDLIITLSIFLIQERLRVYMLLD